MAVMTILSLKEYTARDYGKNTAIKSIWVTTAMDGSDDCLYSERICSLVGPEIIVFRQSSVQKKSPKTLSRH